MIQLRPARPEELEALSELCLRSKAVWGYHRDFLNACRAELSIRPEELQHSHLRVAVREGIVGVVQFTIDGQSADLQKLFVEPSAIGLGVGKVLLGWAAQAARDLGARELTIDADPGAVAFYKKMGAVDYGSVASGSIPGRVLPRLRIALDAR